MILLEQKLLRIVDQLDPENLKADSGIADLFEEALSNGPKGGMASDRYSLTIGLSRLIADSESPSLSFQSSLLELLTSVAPILLASRLYKSFALQVLGKPKGGVNFDILAKYVLETLNQSTYDPNFADWAPLLHDNIDYTRNLFSAIQTDNLPGFLFTLIEVEQVSDEELGLLSISDRCDVVFLYICILYSIETVRSELNGTLPLIVRQQKKQLGSLLWGSSFSSNIRCQLWDIESKDFKSYEPDLYHQAEIVVWCQTPEFTFENPIAYSDVDILIDQLINDHDVARVDLNGTRFNPSEIVARVAALFDSCRGHSILSSPRFHRLSWQTELSKRIVDRIEANKMSTSLGILKLYLNITVPLYFLDLLGLTNLIRTELKLESIDEAVEIASSYGNIDINVLQKFNSAYRLTWPTHPPLSFGYAVCMIEDLKDDLVALRPSEISPILSKMYGEDGEHIHRAVRSKRPIRFCDRIINQYDLWEFGEYVTYCYETAGLLIRADPIVPDRQSQISMSTRLPEGERGAISRLQMPLTTIEPQDSSAKDHLAPRSNGKDSQDSPVIGINMSAAWKSLHNEKYHQLQSDNVKWEKCLAVVKCESKELCDRLIEGSTIELANDLSKKWKGNFKRVLIARWVIIVVERHIPAHLSRLHRMGWLSSSTMSNEYESGFNSYRQYCHKLGFMIPKNGDVLENSFLWPEEREWLATFEPPQ